MVSNDSFKFEVSDLQGVSRIFQVNGEDYLVIVTAVDSVGVENLSFLKSLIVLLVLLGIPVIFLGSFIITTKAFLPISRKIDHANAISASNLHERLKVYNSKDEIGQLAVAFNKLLDRLEVSFAAQKSFIRNASHEIRNPLTAIMGEAEITVSKHRSNEEYVKSLTTIITVAETLNLSVNNLLQLSKVTANEGNIKREIIQFDEFLNDIKISFDFLNPENQVNLKIAENVRNDVYSILGNKNLLKTAIINILDNACKFSSNGKVDVSLTYNNRWIELIIADTGIGIEATDIEKIRTPFYRGNNTLKIRGSGIGFTLSFKIIDIHLGKLEVQSRIEIGTEVHVKLPVQLV
ncbi:MAG: signal transduction histidine kinase [Bacteroidia bacterium]|jgi:signal transduction histidine kinase